MAWEAAGVAVDDLKVIAVNRERILCRGLRRDDLASGIAGEFALDARTGAPL